MPGQHLHFQKLKWIFAEFALLEKITGLFNLLSGLSGSPRTGFSNGTGAGKSLSALTSPCRSHASPFLCSSCARVFAHSSVPWPFGAWHVRDTPPGTFPGCAGTCKKPVGRLAAAAAPSAGPQGWGSRGRVGFRSFHSSADTSCPQSSRHGASLPPRSSWCPRTQRGSEQMSLFPVPAALSTSWAWPRLEVTAGSPGSPRLCR